MTWTEVALAAVAVAVSILLERQVRYTKQLEGALSAVDGQLDAALAQPSADDIQCPVCGYHCLGDGGVGCIDKPGFAR